MRHKAGFDFDEMHETVFVWADRICGPATDHLIMDRIVSLEEPIPDDPKQSQWNVTSSQMHIGYFAMSAQLGCLPSILFFAFSCSVAWVCPTLLITVSFAANKQTSQTLTTRIWDISSGKNSYVGTRIPDRFLAAQLKLEPCDLTPWRFLLA